MLSQVVFAFARSNPPLIARSEMRFPTIRIGLMSKIFAVGAIGSIGLITVAGLYMYGESAASRSQSVADEAILARALTRSVVTQFLEARRAEKDFLLRSDENYIKRHGSVTQNLGSYIDQLTGKLAGLNMGGAAAKLSSVKTGFNAYKTNFAALADAKVKLGLNENLGLEGKLRTSVRAIESSLANYKEVQLTADMLMLRRHEKDFMLRHDPRYVDSHKKSIADFEMHLSQSGIAAAERRDTGQKLADYQRDFLAYAEGFKTVLNTQKEMSDQFAKVEPLIAELEKEIVGVADQSVAEASAVRERTGWQMRLTLLIVLIGGTAASLFVARGITRPIKALSAELQKLSVGNFNISLPWLRRTDEIGEISRSVEQVVQKVGSSIANVKVASNEVSNASAEISTSTTDLSQRTEEQAASLEQTSASMEQITSTVRKTADNATRASQFAEETCRVADRGGNVVADAVEAMGRIEESSRRITDIITVIDEVARQTNLLALNAAVEAARAGEAGRGFAVVASEVRNLAQRSSQAAKDIKELITNSAAQVQAGVGLVANSGTVLKEIVESIQKVSQVIAEIANASHEQSSGVDEINKALVIMDEVTQRNSALVEENAATAKTLEHQAKSMDEQVAFFQIDMAAGAEGMTQAKTVPVQPAVARLAVVQSKADAVADAKADASPVENTRPQAAPQRAAAGGARRRQANLATAVKENAEWKEF